MARGSAAKVGDTFVNANGYHHTRMETGWVLTHRLLMEKKLRRKLRKNEMVRFKDGNKSNVTIENLELIQKKSHPNRRIATLEAKIMELESELASLRGDS